jgi:hypothetical protein
MANKNNTQGFVIATVLITVLFVMTMMIVVVQYGANNYKLSSQEAFRVNAQLAADAGIDEAINQINIDETWSGSVGVDIVGDGTPGEVILLDTPKLRTTYESILIDGASDAEKIISVIARSYSPDSSTAPKVERRYELDIRAVTNGFGAASVVTGVGGLVLDNNAKITGGDVVVNGTIDIANNAQIGTQTNAVNVRVAHYACPQPPNASYPSACSSGDPISIDINGRIYGEVHANNQSSNTNMSNPGLTQSSGVAPVSLTEYDRSSFAVATTLPATDSAIRCNNNQTKTWPANVKITGDVTLGNNCIINITGNVWITGSVNTGNKGTFVVSDTLGATRPVIMIDGQNGFVFGNNGAIQPNSSDTGAEIYTFWSHPSTGCSPDCTNLTGTGLAASQNITTINLANGGSAPYSIFTAQWTRVAVENNGTLGAVAGQSILLSNGAVINFSASISGSDNLTTTWVKRGYMRVYN